jgi:pyruvate formate lyase activating enzyme
MDSAKHEAFTGRPNELILENAKWIAENAHSMTVRVPTIPTFNASVAEIREIAKFANSLPGVKELHLLPYHRLGSDKYTGLGRTYTLPDILPPDKGTMETLVLAAKSVCDLHVQIGG